MKKVKVGDKIKTERGYYGTVIVVKEYSVLVEMGMGFLVKVPLDKLEVLKK